jgi:hypothetical protein
MINVYKMLDQKCKGKGPIRTPRGRKKDIIELFLAK